MLLLVQRGERVFRTGLGHDFEIEGACGGGAHAGAADAGEDGLVDVGEFDEDGLFGDEKDGFFEEEEVALDGLEVGFEAWVTRAAGE